MAGIKICRICLRTEAKGYNFQRFQLKYFYEEVIALKVSDDGLPQWFCFECATILHKFHKFKEKCYNGQKLLKEMLWKGPITYEAIYQTDRKDVQSSLGKIIVTERTKAFNIVDSDLDSERHQPKNEEVMTENKDFLDNTIIESCVDQIRNDEGSLKFIDESSNGFDKEDQHSPISIIVDNKSDIVKLKSDEVPTKNKDASTNRKEQNIFFTEDNWKIVHLTEEEAVNEFREKAKDPKYLESTFKCGDCFRGFSKKDMLNRHVHSRHSEELGEHECRICRMRFKWRCHLRKHIAQHYTKYQCLRCNIIFHLDTSAILHEEYHSGTTKKCSYCNEEFRHLTTYYSHVRTHRSSHVCASCGVSCVSRAGLRHHRARIHNTQNSSEEDEEARQTYCDRCDIWFNSQKAYEEHLFHSDRHSEIIKTEKEDDPAQNRKILGKRLRDKITKELRKLNTEVEAIPVTSKRRKKVKRKHRIPSTCYQCGQQFPSAAARARHHAAAHPRTAPHPPAARHVCELCGACLAPGSVSVHQNMHTREKMHSCETCGKMFHSTVSLKRHTLTHTGEKPFGCPLCEKRFTQSNSMKLHYRTFHLKQPYPKRVRKKKKEEPTQTEKESYGVESSSLPEPEPEITVPEMATIDTGNVHAVDSVHVDMSDENMHYLTLG